MLLFERKWGNSLKRNQGNSCARPFTHVRPTYMEQQQQKRMAQKPACSSDKPKEIHRTKQDQHVLLSQIKSGSCRPVLSLHRDYTPTNPTVRSVQVQN